MATDKYSNIGKDGIVKEGIFVRFPELIPACPENWGNSNLHRKLMIVGESNYFDDNADSVFKDPEAWYTGEDILHLIPDDYKVRVSNWKAEYPPFNNLCKSMNQVSEGFHYDTVYDGAMFYNYFLRPATVRNGNKSFKKDCTQMDREIAGIALCGIIEIDKPEIVVFVSKYAYSEFQKYIDSKMYPIGEIKIDFVYHPSRHFSWHHCNGNGKQKFERLLRDYWIVK